jgi:hypothetical protein
VKAGKLLNSYLAEVVLNSNVLLSSKFISLAELLPDHALCFVFA